MFDPPREDAKATIATALTMGVKIKMVTGDALAIAKETAKTLGMGTNILDAKMLGDSKKQESAEVIDSIEKADGFAEVFPEHKFHIVDVLQKRNHIVGMTGDGVNDAPALKKADCGIAVSSATDAARAAAAIVLLTPGLSVIIDAIKESRRIFQRMNSYAIYRIAETLRVLLFMTLAILVFNFYPLTAVMIVMLALLNDGAILSIAYDNVHYKDKPESWNMRMVLGVSTVLGVIGVVSAFGLFYLGERVFHLDRPHIQTLMYLKLSVAGHLTIFLTRTRGPFWSIRPAKILWMAVFGTQIVATLIAVYGLFMTPLGWGWAGFVWGYALLWFLVNDRIKLLAYRIFDPIKAAAKTGIKPEVKANAETETKSVPQPEAKVETKPDMNSTPETKAKTATDLTPQIAARAYELYEHQGHRDGQSVQNWDKAEQEIRATQTKAEPKAETKPATKAGSAPDAKAQPNPDANSKPAAKVEPKPESKPEAKPEATPELKPEAKTESAPEVKIPATPEAKAVPPSTAKAEPKPDSKTAAKPTDKVEPKPDAQTETKPEPNAKPAAEISPQLVKKVHTFYEQLGREDVRAVQKADEAEQKTPDEETKK
jgi:H+-transporting ATPase